MAENPNITIPTEIHDMDAKSLYKYLHLHESDTISDWNRALNYLASNGLTPEQNYADLQRAITVSAYMDLHRPRNGTKAIAAKVYQQLFPNASIEPARFGQLYAIVNSVLLDSNVLHLDQKCLNAVSLFRNLGEPAKYIYEYIASIQDHPSISSLDTRHSYEFPQQDPSTRRTTFDDAVKVLRSCTFKEDAVCAAYLQADANDILLENCAVYNDFVSLLPLQSKGLSVLIISPSPFFIKKWAIDDMLTGVNAVFAVENSSVCEFFSSRYKNYKDYTFITMENLPDNLNIHKAAPYTLLFANHMQEAGGYMQLLKASADRECHVTVLCCDKEFNGPHSELGELLCRNSSCVDAIRLFPAGIMNETLPRRKMLIHARYGYLSSTQAATIRSFSLQNNDGMQFLRKKPFAAQWDCAAWAVDTGSIRDVYRSQEVQAYRITAGSREMAKEFRFSEEITVYYTASKAQGKGSLPPRIEAYIRYPLCCKDESLRGTPIKSSFFRTSVVPIDAIDAWLNGMYLYGVRKRGKYKEQSVRSVVSQVYQQAYEKQPLTLKTFFYIHPELRDKMPSVGLQRLSNIAYSDLGEVRLDQLSNTSILSALYQMYPPEAEDRALKQAVNALSILFDSAIEHGNCCKNPLKSELQRWQWQAGRIRNVRDNLAKKSFTLEEGRRIFDALRQRLTEKTDDGSMALGLMIRLLTGLACNIVSALQWRDFQKMSGFPGCDSLYQLSVRRQLSNDGAHYTPFEKAISYRVLPCPAILSNLLLAQKNRLMNEQTAEADLDSMPIIGKMRTGPSLQQQIIPPRELSKAGKTLMKSLCLPDDMIQIPNDANGTVESNLAFYFGDIFCENHRHYCMTLCGFDEGEYAYWNGSQPPSTFAKNYCDYANPAAQLILSRKMERWGAALSASGGQRACKQLTVPEVTQFAHTSEGYPTSRTEMELTVTACSPGTISLCVDAEYGFDVSLSAIQEDTV